MTNTTYRPSFKAKDVNHPDFWEEVPRTKPSDFNSLGRPKTGPRPFWKRGAAYEKPMRRG